MKNYFVQHIVFLLCFCGICIHGKGQEFAAHSLLREGQWIQLAIPVSGVYAISTGEVPQLEGVSTHAIALYGTDGLMLNYSNRAYHPDDLSPISISIQDQNGNQHFDAEDRILFYAEGPITWRYDDYLQQFVHHRHSYDTKNYVFLRIGGAEGSKVAAAPSTNGNTTIDSYTAFALYEEEKTNIANSGQLWLGERFHSGTLIRQFTIQFPGNASGNAKLRVGLCNASEGYADFKVTVGSNSRTLNFSPRALYQTLSMETALNAPSSLTCQIEYSPYTNGNVGYLDYIEATATVPLHFNGGQMGFRNTTHPSEGTARFQMSNATSTIRIWDVTRLDSVREISLTSASGTASFGDHCNTTHEYIAFDGTQYLTPEITGTIAAQDIHGASNPDMVIVTHRDFKEEADRIATLHTLYDGMEVMVVTQEEVFNEFSGGKKDPMAIRQMMRLFYNRQKADPQLNAPTHLLLFGKATYDNRNLLENNFATLVTFQAPQAFSTDCSVSPSDDFFAYLDDSEEGFEFRGIDISVGRLPAKNKNEALLMVDKIERYMTREDLQYANLRGDWRTFVALLADDADPSCPGDKDFCASSEYLANRINESYPWITLDKIYADAYTQESGAIGSYYPDVNNALKQRMDYGCLLLNYIGHGSDQYIGTERYMELSDIANYSNLKQLAFFVTSTCSFGKYDRLDGMCGSEAFVLAPGAGVACLAAARPISHMRTFNSELVMQALARGNTIGDAVRRAKNTYPQNQNRAITLIGDPALQLSFPEHQVRVTQINGKAVEEGVADSVKVLSRVTVEGVITNAEGNVLTDFNGWLFPVVYDRKAQCRTLANDNEGTEVDFTQQKSILYKGRDSVVNGHFSYSFIVPRDVAYQYDYGKLSHYAKSATSDAAGAYQNILFGGFDETIDITEIRPEIRLFINDSNFRNGGLTDANPRIFAIVNDEVGINAVGSGLGHDITAIVDGNVNNVYVLNDFYETDINDIHRGYINYGLLNLSPGRHSITVKVWNIFNYSNSATIDFVVGNSDSTQIGQFACHPNPATNRTQIRVEHNGNDAIASAQIEIFDLLGRKVKAFDPVVDNDSFVIGPIEWDFRNQAGAVVAPGMYVARVVITTTAGEHITATTKIVRQR